MLNQRVLPYLITLGLCTLGSPPTFAQSYPHTYQSYERIFTKVLFTPPPDEPKPDGSKGAGSRQDGSCFENVASSQTTLQPLVPSSYFGLTVTERPTLWLMIPKTSARQVILNIQDENNNYHSQTPIPITGESGLIGVQPSDDTPPLEVGKTYRWSVVLVCGEKLKPDDPGIVVSVRRKALSESLNDQSPLKQAKWYGEQGIWYDALNLLVEVRQLNPNNPDLTRIWHEFLESGDVSLISDH